MGESLPWRVVAASVQGTSHQKRGQPCQDAHAWRVLADGTLIAAVADGAGSASHSEIGSQVAVAVALEQVADRLESGVWPEHTAEGWRAFWLSILPITLAALEAEAAAQQVALRDLATTLIVLVATSDRVCVVQIGDGAALLRDAQGQFQSLTVPPEQESLDLATFVTSLDAFVTAQTTFWQGKVAQLALLTDGLQMLALKMPAGIPHEPFFVPLFEFVRQMSDVTQSQQQLTAFLTSGRVTDRADDDLTLLLAAHWSDPDPSIGG